MDEKTSIRRYLFYAVLASLLLHGSVMWFTFEKTYDAFVHIFFADHYVKSWWEPWDFRWYTGFTTTSYPPLVHQMVGTLSKIVGLKAAFVLWNTTMTAVFTTGVFRFSSLLTPKYSVKYSLLMGIGASAILEMIHVFGQAPTLTGISFLLLSLPNVYNFFRTKESIHLVFALALIGAVCVSHHVTTIFGSVFFILPTVYLGIVDRLDSIKIKSVVQEVWRQKWRLVLLGLGIILITIVSIFPYWYWSATDPISQIPIHHSSRDSFLVNSSAGFIFFIVPWGVQLLMLPYFVRYFSSKRHLAFLLSFLLLFLLGTGGTTPLPKMILGEHAFNILTFDRFTIWASIMTLPIAGKFLSDYSTLSAKSLIKSPKIRFSRLLVLGITGSYLLIVTIGILNLSNFKPLQPSAIKVDPIINFLNKDNHKKWRFLTLGFGDQMAWLSANTDALSVDGNYHSARRLPELTTRAVERLENSKYSGVEGLGSLQQFLTKSDKYHLKYIFSNDKFYDPLLYFSGWQPVQRLENGVMVWDKPDVPPLPQVLPVKSIPTYQKVMWGSLPIAMLSTMILLALLLPYLLKKTKGQISTYLDAGSKSSYTLQPGGFYTVQSTYTVVVAILLLALFGQTLYENIDRTTPKRVLVRYYNALDFKKFETAFALCHPEKRSNLAQFTSNFSKENGLLASYAKLESIEVLSTKKNQNETLFTCRFTYITALKSYVLIKDVALEKKENKWWIVPDEPTIKTASNQFISRPESEFLNLGRRSNNVQATNDEEVMDRPAIRVIESNLVQHDSSLFLVGSIQNVDDYPAYADIQCVVKDAYGHVVADYNAMDVIKHKLLPKERSLFRIDLANSLVQTTSSSALKPETFTVFVKATVADGGGFASFGLQNVRTSMEGNELQGSFWNYSPYELTVPALLTGLRNENGHLLWVDQRYFPKGIQPQKSRDFVCRLTDLSGIETILVGQDHQFIVNGKLNSHYKHYFRSTQVRPTIKTNQGQVEYQAQFYKASLF